jgi:hypothetical protein
MQIVNIPDKSHLQQLVEAVYGLLTEDLCDRHEKGERYYRRTHVEFNLPMKGIEIGFVKRKGISASECLGSPSTYGTTYILAAPFDVEMTGGGSYIAKNPL